MRLTIFWRVILAQSALVALVLAVSLYALSKFNWFTQLQTSILTVDSACIKEEKQLLRIFLQEMRNAEKYLVLGENVFYAGFVRVSSDFNDGLKRVAALVDAERERSLAEDIANLHALYESEIEDAIPDKKQRDRTKSEIGEAIIEKINELIRQREQKVMDKATLARKESVDATTELAWWTVIAIAGALLLAYLHARGVSRPLKQLTIEMGRVGKGEFSRSVSVRAPWEVHRLAEAFNRMAAELAELDRLKSDFTAHVSHELRTPLTAIREGTTLLLEEIPGPLIQGQREILKVVHNHCERLCHTIASVLDLSKMEARMMEYEFTLCDLPGLIRSSVDAVKLFARKKGIELRTVLTDPFPILALDERRITQVLDNLLNNALKFTSEGGRVVVSGSIVREMEGRNRWVEVKVADTGEGIPEEEATKVFERFYQSPHGRAGSRQGTGLGLAIARHIVEAHEGRIWLESEPGKGSSFIFALPVDSGPGAISILNGTGPSARTS